MFHKFLMALRTWWAAIEHARSGGKTTKRRAVRRAQAWPRKCPTCQQTVPHSSQWRDHYDLRPSPHDCRTPSADTPDRDQEATEHDNDD